MFSVKKAVRKNHSSVLISLGAEFPLWSDPADHLRKH